MAHGYREVLSSPPFLALVVSVTANFAAVFVYIVSAPAFLLDLLHVGETGFLWLFGPVSAGMMLGNWASGALAGRMTNQRTILWGYVLMIAAAGGNLALHARSAPALPWSVVPLVVYVLGASLAMPSLTLMALDLFPHRRGMAASCQAFVQTSGNALVIAVLAPLLWGSALTLALGMAGALLVGAVAFGAYAALHRRAVRSPRTRPVGPGHREPPPAPHGDQAQPEAEQRAGGGGHGRG
jgi:DHA1 family bicyclomycin/chloramphenicol resistance-like MFS transporter